VSSYNKTNLTYQTIATLVDITTLKSGWNLVSSKNIRDLNNTFKNKNISFIWRWKDGIWEFYSPKANLTASAISAGYTTIKSIDDFDGFWIYFEYFKKTFVSN
jgi:hypothetical protein